MGTAIDLNSQSVYLEGNFRETVAAAKSGQVRAWASLYQTIAGPVTGFFRARGVRDPIDLTGDVFFDVARSISKFSGDESDFRTFVFIIAFKRLAEDRTQSTHRRSHLADNILETLNEAPESESTDSDGLRTQQVRKSLESLNAEQRDVISLRLGAGLSLQETAAVIDRKLRQVTNIQRRAVSRLQNAHSTRGGLA